MKKHILIAVTAFALLSAGFLSFLPPLTTQGGKPNPTFLFLSDVHLDMQSKETEYKDDTGTDLWAAFLIKVEQILSGPNSPNFIVYTGDLPAHYQCWGGCYIPPAGRGTHDTNISVILTRLNGLAAKYKKPIFYLPGNNDALAGDYYSFADEQLQTPLSLVKTSGYFFPNRSMGQVPGMVSDPHAALGFYSATPEKGLRIIALNTVIYDANFTTADGTTQKSDGNAQMTWLSAQLADAASKNEKVYIAMHIPPGMNAYGTGTNPMWTQLQNNQNWNNSFLTLTMLYKNTIAGIMYGHTHMDEARRLYDTSNKYITEVAISCPGVTPQHKNNPGFRVVQYDAASKELMDYTTYYTTPSVKKWGSNTYTFTSVYGGNPASSVFERLSGMTLTAASDSMLKTYRVMHGYPNYIITPGIEVFYNK